jgi:hypothetical protein
MKPHFFPFFIIMQLLLVADYATTMAIFSLGGIELNPIVNAIGLVPLTIYKLFAGFSIGVLSYLGHDNRVIYGMCAVFSIVVGWNAVNVLYGIF